MVDPLLRLAANVRARRRALDLTQEAAACRASMGMSYWGRMERATVEPGVRAVVRAAAALETTPADLFAGIGEEADGRSTR